MWLMRTPVLQLLSGKTYLHLLLYSIVHKMSSKFVHFNLNVFPIIDILGNYVGQRKIPKFPLKMWAAVWI